MHANSHQWEAAFKAHCKGGFHKLVNSVLKRPKLPDKAFKTRKFQEQNLNHIQELSEMLAVRMALLLFKNL